MQNQFEEEAVAKGPLNIVRTMQLRVESKIETKKTTKRKKGAEGASEMKIQELLSVLNFQTLSACRATVRGDALQLR
jgi:hypothetical protein